MTVYQWNQLGINEITNLYLYGQTTTPSNLRSDSIIRPPVIPNDPANPKIDMDAVSFMASGPGRFANASKITLVQAFMNAGFVFKENGNYQEFTLDQAIAVLGKDTQDLSILQSNYQDTSDDLLMRAYVYQSSSYTISKDARFIIEADGTRRIENFAILPYHDNFDFKSDSLTTIIANAGLKPKIDPTDIGRKFDIKFTEESKNAVARTTYTLASLEADQQRYSATFQPISGTAEVGLAVTSGQYADDLWNAGVTKLLDSEGRFIIHGTDGADNFSTAGVDSMPIRSELRMAMYKNGVALIGGSGNDVLKGSICNDYLEGGADADSLMGGYGTDTYRAGDGDKIADTDALGTVYVGSRQLTGGTRSKKDGANAPFTGADGSTYTLSGNTLTVHTASGDVKIATAFKSETRKGVTTLTGLGITLTTIDDDSAADDTWTSDFGDAKQTFSPLVLDLNGDGVQTTRLSNSFTQGVHFNLDATGLAENTAWVDAQDGLLVRDLNGDGQINSGRELFGNHTLLHNGAQAANGFEALKELDNNADGVVDANDALFASLKVWKDTNSDGVTDTGELLTLSEAGVQSLKVAYANYANYGTTTTDPQGNAHLQQGSYTTTDGSTRNMNDVWFAVDTARTVDTELVTVSEAIAQLPNLANMGNLRSLHQAMARDSSGTLQALVARYQSEARSGTPETLLQDILYRWAGVQDVDPASRGGYINGQQLAVVEQLLGQTYYQHGGGYYGPTINDPGPYAAAKLLALYEQIKTYYGVQLDAQTVCSEDLAAIDITWDEQTQDFVWDVSQVVSQLRTQFDTSPEETVTHLDRLAAVLKSMGSAGYELLRQMQQQGSAQDGDLFGNALRLMGGLQLVFSGTAGNDTLSGNAEKNYFYAHAGNDMLSGGEGDDSYYFNAGDGQDVVLDVGRSRHDAIYLGEGIRAEQVQLSRGAGEQADDLILDLGNGDRLTVQYYFYAGDYRVENINFADGARWSVADVMGKFLQSGTEGDDLIYGVSDYDNQMDGLAGDDTLVGGNGMTASAGVKAGTIYGAMQGTM